MHHHIFFKRQNPALYWILIREIVGNERWERVEAWIKDRRAHKVDFKSKLSELGGDIV
jgi:hypothetical protein